MLVACNKSKRYTLNKCGIGSNHEVTDGNKCNGNIQLIDEVLRDKSAKVKTPVNEEFILTGTEKNDLPCLCQHFGGSKCMGG